MPDMCHYFRHKALFPCLWYCPAWHVSLFQCLLYCPTWCVLISVPAVLSDMMCPYFHACDTVRHVSLFQCCGTVWHGMCPYFNARGTVWHGMCLYFSACCTVWHGICVLISVSAVLSDMMCPYFSACCVVWHGMCHYFSAWCSQTCIHFSLPCSFVQHNNINVMHRPSAVNGRWQRLHIVTWTAYSHLAFSILCDVTTKLWRDRPCDVTQQTWSMTDPVTDPVMWRNKPGAWQTLWCDTTNLWHDSPCDVTQQTWSMTDPIIWKPCDMWWQTTLQTNKLEQWWRDCVGKGPHSCTWQFIGMLVLQPQRKVQNSMTTLLTAACHPAKTAPSASSTSRWI